MYTLLAGRLLFKAATLLEMLQLQRFAEPDPVVAMHRTCRRTAVHHFGPVDQGPQFTAL